MSRGAVYHIVVFLMQHEELIFCVASASSMKCGRAHRKMDPGTNCCTCDIFMETLDSFEYEIAYPEVDYSVEYKSLSTGDIKLLGWENTTPFLSESLVGTAPVGPS